ncbi:hypothetical protein ACQPZJ_18700 [Actinoplanes sp. CA-054009]
MQLIERVIEAVTADPSRLRPLIDGSPQPMPASDIAELDVPPSLRRWLAFDSRFPSLDSMTLTQYVQSIEIRGYEGTDLDEPDEDDASWNDVFSDTSLRGLARFDRVLQLPSPNADVGLHHVLVASEPDAEGEWPVFYYADLARDIPEYGLWYPGFDVYLAHLTGLIDLDFSQGISSLGDHPDHAARMAHHARHCFNGKRSGSLFG